MYCYYLNIHNKKTCKQIGELVVSLGEHNIKSYHNIMCLFIVADFHKVHLSVYNIILCVVRIVVASDNLISYPCRHVVANPL